MTTGIGPYVVPYATDSDDTGLVGLETTLVASEALVDIDGSGNLVHAEVFNGAIPGPTFRLTVGQTVVVRLVNNLPHPTGIHWHGVELENYSDGTELTQDGALAAPAQTLVGGASAGGTFLYKFKVPRPGIYWYHPHHHNSLNRLFRGMYGMIVVTEPGESSIVSTPGMDRVLPADADTMQVVLSDTTVCGATNPTRTYVDPTTLPAADRPEWASGATNQLGPSPKDLCELPATGGSAADDDGNALPTATITTAYGAGFIPSGMRPSTVSPRAVEGRTVLTNGVNVGGRLGTPDRPGALVTVPGTPPPRDVLAGQGLRLQIVNCSVLRYFRLRLTYPDASGNGVQVPIVRIGGEGGLLDNAIREGGTIGTTDPFDTNYDLGEILLPPATRADIVVAVPTQRPDLTPLPVGTVLTLWTRDYKRTGDTNLGNWAQFPTVPVMHLTITGTKPGAPYTITGGTMNSPATGTALRSAAGMAAVADLLTPTPPLPTTLSTLLAGPASPPRPAGFVNANIKIKTGSAPSIDDVAGMFMPPAGGTFAQIPHLGSSRYAEQNRLYELQVTNASQGNANHPFHLHGFSFQPIRIEPRTGAAGTGSTGSYTWQFREFRDTIELPRNHTLTFRLVTGPRPLADGTTPGGEFGRWLFHCHIFFHHTRGMVGEFVVTSADGREKPTVSVGGSWAYAPLPGGNAHREGKFYSPSGRRITSLTSTLEDGITAIGMLTATTGVSSGDWQWDYNAPVGDTARIVYVYITATDEDGRKDQAVFRLQVGGAGTGSDTGDPHLVTVDGKRYDFQAAGEFVLLRDRENGMEIQVRQTPAETPPPITDDYSGLTACVSLNTAVAARVGRHRIAFQPKQRGQHRFFLDGQPEVLTREGFDLGGHRVSGFDVPDAADEELGLRVDFAHGAVLTVTPLVWTSYGIRYLDVHVSNTQADEGIMGRIPKGTWLPALPNGATLGPRPASLQERYLQLYETFADSWRVTDATSMFEYAPGTSTATFTDEDWPGPPPEPGDEFPVPPSCKLKPKFQKALKPIEKNIDLEEAKRICQDVTIDDLNAACVFDVAATGDAEFAKGYMFVQELRRNSTRVHIVADKPVTKTGESLKVTAIVVASSAGRPTPTGSVTFLVDGMAAGPPVKLDADGKASTTITTFGPGGHSSGHGGHGGSTPHDDGHSEHLIRAAYTPDKTYHSSSSPSLLHTVLKRKRGGVGTTVVSLPTIWIWILLLLLLILIIMLGIHMLG
jgi:FtsP/CotA-like multicopper oxidase with cupredoxin domain